MGCVFCDIVSGKISAKKIYEDDKVLAFYDSSPQAPIHFLIIPKKHVESFSYLEGDEFVIIGEIFKSLKKMAKNLGISAGLRIVNNCGKEAGQTVPHMHFHILSGRKFGWPPG